MTKWIKLSNGYSLAYDDIGNPNDPCPVFCAHGLIQTRHTFDELADFLVRQNRRIIKPDFVGHGESEWSKDPSRYDPPFYAEDCAEMLRVLNVPTVDWIGISLGGLVGIQSIGRLGIKANHIALVDIAPEYPISVTHFLADWIETKRVFKTLDEFVQWRVDVMQAIGPLSDEQRRYRAAFDYRKTPDGFVSVFDPNLAINIRLASNRGIPYDDWASYRKIKCPILVLHGKESEFLPQDVAEKMQKIVPHTQVIHIPNVGHYPAMTDNAQQQALLHFLTDTATPSSPYTRKDRAPGSSGNLVS